MNINNKCKSMTLTDKKSLSLPLSLERVISLYLWKYKSLENLFIPQFNMKRAFLFAIILLFKVFIKSPKLVQSTRLSKVTFGNAKNEENRLSTLISKVSSKCNNYLIHRNVTNCNVNLFSENFWDVDLLTLLGFNLGLNPCLDMT